MDINPVDKDYTETYPLSTSSDEFIGYQKRFEESLAKEDIVAIGPEDHLKILQEDLRKAGYKKRK